MLPYQERYVQNVREIAALRQLGGENTPPFAAWQAQRLEARARMDELRRENTSLLADGLFPALDGLFSASAEDIAALEQFADQLMDWRTNLDCGVYVAIHDALLRLNRVRRDRDGVVRELYKLGMGLYYLRRLLMDVSDERADAFAFQNEMLFTEAGSYIRHFEQIESEETKGYIIRAWANVALCAKDHKRRIATSARTLRIAQDERFRALAPSLPWDVFVRRTHQQMSANRNELSRGNLTTEELAAVLDSCYEVFKPEEGAEKPSVRWLWPYYEMEYNCGLVSLDVTLERLRRLCLETAYDQYDMSGLYGNVQLPVYCGRLMRMHKRLRDDPELVRFLDEAYRKMLRTLLTCPPEGMDDYFFYCVSQVVTEYYEMEGVPSYREVIDRLLPRFAGEEYVRARKAGAAMRLLAEALLERDGAFFDDIPFLREMRRGADKTRAACDFADACGVYMDFGRLKMNIARTARTRDLFEDEYRMMQLHTVSAWTDLRARPSTERFADIALGHHRWYNGADGYPERYERNASPYRQMTDLAAVVSFLIEREDEPFADTLAEVLRRERRQFSPLVTACLADEGLVGRLRAALRGDESAYYRELYKTLYGVEP